MLGDNRGKNDTTKVFKTKNNNNKGSWEGGKWQNDFLDLLATGSESANQTYYLQVATGQMQVFAGRSDQGKYKSVFAHAWPESSLACHATAKVHESFTSRTTIVRKWTFSWPFTWIFCFHSLMS